MIEIIRNEVTDEAQHDSERLMVMIPSKQGTESTGWEEYETEWA